MKRLFDVLLALVIALVMFIPGIVIAILIRMTSPGPALYWSDRVGRHSGIFRMPKFRTMRLDTPEAPTSELENPQGYITPLGAFLRKTSLDELPQLLSILRGDMSFVGPRPVLRTEYELIELRKQQQVDIVPPGLTGWAQINGRDALTYFEKVALDREYVERISLWFDLKILAKTCRYVLLQHDISH